jgi:hypothetical protein
VRTRVTGSISWDQREYDDLDPGASVELLTEFVGSDASIEVEVAYQTGDGRFSDWSATSTVSTSTSGLAPSPPSGVTATGHTGNAVIGWTNPVSNFSYARVYRGTTSTFGSASQVGGDIVGGPAPRRPSPIRSRREPIIGGCRRSAPLARDRVLPGHTVPS